MTTLTLSLRLRLLEALEPFKRVDTAIGSEPGPFRFETGSGHRLVERGDFRRLAALYDELKSANPDLREVDETGDYVPLEDRQNQSEGGGKDAPIAASPDSVAPSENASATSEPLRSEEHTSELQSQR